MEIMLVTDKDGNINGDYSSMEILYEIKSQRNCWFEERATIACCHFTHNCFFFFFCVCLLIMVLLCSLYTPIQRIIIIIHHTETLVRFDCSLRYESKWTKGALQMLLPILITFFLIIIIIIRNSLRWLCRWCITTGDNC